MMGTYDGFLKRGYPNSWMVYFMENPKTLMITGVTHVLGNLHSYCIILHLYSNYPRRKKHRQVNDHYIPVFQIGTFLFYLFWGLL